MFRFLTKAAYAAAMVSGAIAFMATAQATEENRVVQEGQGIVTALGTKASAVTYWTSQADGWHVVTTVNTAGTEDTGSDGNVVRFTSVLAPGQSQSISVPVAIGEVQPVLNIRRVADRIEIEQEPVLSY